MSYTDPIDDAAAWLCGGGGAQTTTECLIAGFAQFPAAALFAFVAVFLIETPPPVLASSAPFQRVQRWPWFLTIACSAALLGVSAATLVAFLQGAAPQWGEVLAAGTSTAAWALHTLAMVRRWTRRCPIGDYVLAWWLLCFALDVAGTVATYVTWRREGLPSGWADEGASILAFARLAAIAPLAGLAGAALCLTDRPTKAGDDVAVPLLSAAADGAAVDEPGVGPFDRAGLLSRALFWYINPLMKAGYAHPLEKADLPALSWDDRAPQVEARFAEAWERGCVAAEAKAAKVAAAEAVRTRRRLGGGKSGTGGGARRDDDEGEQRSLLTDGARAVPAAARVGEPAAGAAAPASPPPRPRAHPSLVSVLFSAFGPTFFHAMLFKLSFDVIQFTGPLLLDAIVTYLADAAAGRSPPAWLGFVYTAVLLGSSLLQTALLHQYFHRVFRVGQHLRSAIILAVYNKTLRLSLASRAGAASSTGMITNLMSTDAKRLCDLTSYLMTIISGPFQIFVAIFLLWRQIGVSVFAGVAVIVIFLPVNGFVARWSKNLQSSLMKLKDKRVSLTSEAMTGIRLIKFNAWEAAFEARIRAVREEELVQLNRYMLVQQVSAVLWTGLPLIVMLAAFGAYALINGGPPPAAALFTAVSLFTLLRFPMSMLPAVINAIVEAQVSVQRIEAFLAAEELAPDAVARLPAARAAAAAPGGPPDSVRVAVADDVHVVAPLGLAFYVPQDAAIWVSRGTFRWGSAAASVAAAGAPVRGRRGCCRRAGPVALAQPAAASDASSRPVLVDVNIVVRAGALVAVVGSVGSGKTSLCHALLGELQRVSGAVALRGRVAYVPQSPFVLSASVRDNILFGAPFRAEHYEAVLEACALRQDLAALPAGDATEVGERGIALSGGQRARVALARAVYADADVYIFDDVLSAVDAHVGAHVFERVLGPSGLLAGRARLLVTHGLQYARLADEILVMSGGRVIERGTYEALVTRKRGPALCALMATFDRETTDTLTAATTTAASAAAGAGAARAQPSAVQPGKPPPGERAPPPTTAPPRSPAAGAKPAQGVLAAVLSLGRGRQTTTETRERGRVRAAVYAAYARAIGGWSVTAVILALFCGYQAASIWTSAYLSLWSAAATGGSDTRSNGSRLTEFAAYSVGTLGVLVVLRVAVSLSGVRASRVLHDALMSTLLRAPMSFMDTTPLGRLLNRCSQDVYVVDESLPSTFSSFLSTLLSVVGTLALIGAVTPWFLVGAAPLMLVYFALQRYYVATSRELQRLDSVSKSPLFGNFGETLAGVVTVRAFGQAARFAAVNAAALDANQRAYAATQAANRWLAVRVETIGALVVAASAFFAVLDVAVGSGGGGAAFPALAGLSIATALATTQTLNWLVRMLSDAETQVVSVERLEEYANMPRERDREGAEEPPPGWPTTGRLSIRDLRLRYRPTTPWVLRGLSAEIRGGEKVGIAGRTGAGKSSLVTAIFLTADGQDGVIEIDGVDITRVPLATLRSRLTIIPQDPVLFKGSLRRNLDVLGGQFSDERLWAVLRAVSMADTVKELPGALDATVEEGGGNFSSGQRQLITVARALLRNSRVTLIDEASSSVDVESDAALQRAIRSQFAASTVLTIAHRVATILDSDRVMVMRDGRVAEFDAPAALLANESSEFALLVRESQRGAAGAAGDDGEGAALMSSTPPP